MGLFVQTMLLITSSVAPVLIMGLFTYYWFIRKEVRGAFVVAAFVAWYFWIGKEGPGTAVFQSLGPRMLWTACLAALPALVPLESWLCGIKTDDMKLKRGGLLGFCFAAWSAVWGATLILHWSMILPGQR